MPDRKVHVVLRKEDLDPERLAGKIVMVIDTLFATTTIVTALAHGAAEVLPAGPEPQRSARHRPCERGRDCETTVARLIGQAVVRG